MRFWILPLRDLNLNISIPIKLIFTVTGDFMSLNTIPIWMIFRMQVLVVTKIHIKFSCNRVHPFPKKISKVALNTQLNYLDHGVVRPLVLWVYQ